MKSKRKLLPGTLLYTGEKEKETVIKHIKYSKKSFEVLTERHDLEDEVVDWIAVEGLSTVDTIRELCESFHIDNLVIEDILHVNQRTKIEVHDDYIFVVVKYSFVRDNKIEHDYMSMVLFDNVFMTFSELENSFIDDVISRVKNQKSQIRDFSHDYLFYVLYDMIVDEAMEVLYFLDERLEELEEVILELTEKDQLGLYNVRKELVFLRGMTMQLLTNNIKEIVGEKRFFSPKTHKYYEDVNDHLLNINARAIGMLEISKHILDVYMNNMSNRMNKIMTTLTIFSAIFIPLSFIAGVFGMNFIDFPILQNPHGMLYFILICLVIPVLMLTYFRIRKWF